MGVVSECRRRRLRHTGSSMAQTEPLIVIVGGADTGRAPMAAALLRRLLERSGSHLRAESAGVVGHDGAEVEPEARDALLALGVTFGEHSARSLSDELAAEAQLLLAVDTGVAHVLRARYPAAHVVTLGELAGRPRDIPDPFRMQVGAWLHYAGEIEALLVAGLPRLSELLSGQGDRATPAMSDRLAPPSPRRVSRSSDKGDEPFPSSERTAAVERVARLLALLADLPEVVDWPGASASISTEFAAMERPTAAGDLVRPYLALLRAALALAPKRPSPAQALILREAVLRLRDPIGPAELDALSGELTQLGSP